MADKIAVLDKINAGRTALGAPPLAEIPKGIRSSSCECPIARAFKDIDPSVKVGGFSIDLGRTRAYQFAGAIGGQVDSINGRAQVRSPFEFSQFVADFDNGHYPELEARF